MIFPPDMIEYLKARALDKRHATVPRCLLDEGISNQILLGMVDPSKCYDDILTSQKANITKWGGVLKFYNQDPALGYFQWTEGDLARSIGYPTNHSGFSGSDDQFSLRVIETLGITYAPLLEKPVLHLHHGKSNWKGLPACQWL